MIKTAKDFFEGQLKKLQKAHVADLMKVRRHEELEKILEEVELDFFPIVVHYKEKHKSIYQSKEEIPEEFLYELALYMQQSNLTDGVFFLNYEDYRDLLLEQGEEVASEIADKMIEHSLCNYTIKELLEKNLTEQKVKRFLKGQLKKLQEAHVADLMKAGRYKELEEILKEIELDFSLIKEFFNAKEEAIYQSEEEILEKIFYELVSPMQPIKEFHNTELEAIYQSEEEIPKEFLYELALYMQQSKMLNDRFFADEDDFLNLLYGLEEKVAEHLANCMFKDNLRNYTLEELFRES